MKTGIRFFIGILIQIFFANLLFAGDESLQQTLGLAQIPEYHYQVVTVYPHSINNYTQGLFFENGWLYESTGLYGKKSRLIKTELSTGKIAKEVALKSHYFGEGMTVLNNEIFQLTWKENTGFVYDKETFAEKKTFRFEDEGWGLTTNGKELIMSNGTPTIAFLDPVTFKKTRTLTVTVSSSPVNNLNELEYIDNMIYANVWMTPIILVISPQDGKVQGWFQIRENQQTSCHECVANGIAYNDQEKLIYVTGKNWPYLYAIKLGK